jgi:uncharacterized protein YgbK (DUF1537 family)
VTHDGESRVCTLTILADDLTGACDSGTLFAGKAPVAVTVWPRPAPEAPVRVIDIESRRLAPASAATRVRAAAASSTGRWFKKIDSTLRGPIGAEVDALVTALGAPGAIVCPAFPAQRRVVRERELRVDGRAITSVVELLRAQVETPLAWIPLEQVREGLDALAARLGRLAGTIAVADAETDADLAALVDAALEREPAPLLVGAAGLAGALARRLGLLAERPTLPRARRWLVVVGSRHPVSRRQAEVARRAGLHVLTTPDTGADSLDAARALAREARALLEAEAFDLLAVTGGETALALFEALAAERIDLVGAPRDGLALGHLLTRDFGPLPLLTKAGGFGTPDLLADLAKEAA